MNGFGKANATGRSSGKLSGRDGKWRRAPEGEPWVWMTREMLSSPAMRAISLNGRRLLDRLQIEHANHAGTENGNLMATHEQLVEFGLSRRLIADAINELVFFGFVRVERGRFTRAGVKAPNLFRLTFYPDAEGRPATNEWKGMTEEAIAVWMDERGAARKAERALAAQRKERALREDIEVPPKSGGGETAKNAHLRLVQPPKSRGGNGHKVGVED